VAVLAAPAQADIYTFTDEQGVAHFTNVPADARYQVLLKSAPPVSEAGAPISARMLARSAEFDSIIESAAAQVAVQPELLRAVIVVESGFDPDAVSHKGARGLMQLMPATAKAYGANDAGDPAQNIHAGARYLRALLNRYEDDLELTLAAYNAGETAVERYGNSIPPFDETRRYVPKVMKVYRDLMSLSIKL
jgi:soluble lytic murein transglycosylase-like protein